MTERPILFSGPMVRAILEGRKTQTRRIVKPQPYAADRVTYIADKYNGGPSWAFWNGQKMSEPRVWDCPYGVPGDRLWVRETCDYYGGDKYEPPEKRMTIYRADEGATPKANGTWCPSILMPRWASRITLEVTEVRVERLQDITETDAISEGVFTPNHPDFHVGGYRELWESINGKGSWDANPWVWVISFRRLRYDR